MSLNTLNESYLICSDGNLGVWMEVCERLLHEPEEREKEGGWGIGKRGAFKASNPTQWTFGSGFLLVCVFEENISIFTQDSCGHPGSSALRWRCSSGFCSGNVFQPHPAGYEKRTAKKELMMEKCVVLWKRVIKQPGSDTLTCSHRVRRSRLTDWLTDSRFHPGGDSLMLMF